MADEYPEWMATEARAHLEAVCQAIERDARQGTSAGRAQLLVVELPKLGIVRLDARHYVSVGGFTLMDTHRVTMGERMLDMVAALLRDGTATVGTGDPDVSMDLALLAGAVGAYAIRAGRMYATIYMRDKGLVMGFLDLMPVTDPAPLFSLLSAARRALIGQDSSPDQIACLEQVRRSD